MHTATPGVIASSKTNIAAWSEVNTPFTITDAGFYAALTTLSSTDVAYIDSTSESLRVYRLTAGTWAQVGDGLTIAHTFGPALATLNSTDVAYIDSTNESLRTYRFNGTIWSQVGNSLSILVNNDDICGLNGNTIAMGGSSDNLRTYSFDGTDWSQDGNTLALAPSGIGAIVRLTASTVAFVDSVNASLQTYNWDGTDWTTVGNSIVSQIGTGMPSMGELNSSTVAYIDSTTENLRTFTFDGTDWSQVGDVLNIVGVGFGDLTAISSTDVVEFDTGSIKDLRTYRFV